MSVEALAVPEELQPISRTPTYCAYYTDGHLIQVARELLRKNCGIAAYHKISCETCPYSIPNLTSKVPSELLTEKIKEHFKDHNPSLLEVHFYLKKTNEPLVFGKCF